MEEFEYRGIWWLPANPDKKISGTLKFHPVEGTNLELIGSFKEINDLNNFKNQKIILGISSGKSITLYQCYESQFHVNMQGHFCSSFTVNVVFLGHHFEKDRFPTPT